MKAVLLKEYGGIDGIDFEEIPAPEIASNEVLVRVETASVNPLDVKLISGNLRAYFPLALPYPLGTDLAGRFQG
jgi:NADPH:quinone reductase-like Zn-dependent oxidoreductase